MQMTIDIPEKDLIEFGTESIYKEISTTIKWLKMKNSLKKLSKELIKLDEKYYWKEIESIRQSAWNDYSENGI